MDFCGRGLSFRKKKAPSRTLPKENHLRRDAAQGDELWNFITFPSCFTNAWTG